MNRSLKTHGGWLLVTVGTFFVGSQVARQSDLFQESREQSSDGYRSVEALANSAESDDASTVAVKEGNKAPLPGSGSPLQPLSSLEKITASGWTGPVESLEPLTKEEITDLVLRSIRSPNPVERRKAFDRILQEMQSDSFTVEQAMTMRSVMHHNGANGEHWRLFDYAWGANDPEAALAYVEKIPERYRDGYTGNMLPGLASAAPQRAIDLVSSMEGRKYHHMTGRLLEGLVDHDVGFATNYVFELAKRGTPGAAHHMNRLSREVMGTVGLEAGVAWAEQLDAGDLQAVALRQVANRFTNEDPKAAAEWARQFSKNDQNSRLFGEVVREWGDVNAATAWMESLEPSLAQRDALSAVYGFRGAKEPHAAVQDILNMPPSDNRNFAINGFISGLAHQDPEAAVLWAAEITEPGMRQAAMVRAGQQYFRQDTESAIEWLATSGLPKEAWGKVTARRR